MSAETRCTIAKVCGLNPDLIEIIEGMPKVNLTLDASTMPQFPDNPIIIPPVSNTSRNDVPINFNNDDTHYELPFSYRSE